MHVYLEGLAPTLLVAHRGGAALAPENTLTAFRMAAASYQADIVEMDVHATSDGTLVVSHDPTLQRCTDGEGPISELDIAAVRARDAGYRFTRDGGRTYPYRGQGILIPLLSEVLREVPVRMNVEIKPANPQLATLLAAELRRAGSLGTVCSGSEHAAVGERLVKELPEGCFFFPREALTRHVRDVAAGREPEATPYQVLDVPFVWEGRRIVDARLVEDCRRRSLWLNVWTVDDPPSMRHLLNLGVGGIMTDRPDLLRMALSGAA